MEKPTFFARRALIILVVIFFLVPFALRGARMGLREMKNEVKDWLPRDLEETKDLDEFRRYFLSEQFVLVSWDGCHGDAADERFKLFMAKLTPELPPSETAPRKESEEGDVAEAVAKSTSTTIEGGHNPTRYLERTGDFVGDRLGLFGSGDWHENWGGRQEKWICGARDDQAGANQQCWYYLTPDGDLFRWDTVDSPLAMLYDAFLRRVAGSAVSGELVHSFGPVDGAWYYSDPRRLRASLFKTVVTGPDVLSSLSEPGGELSATKELREEAKRRLAGVFFGPDEKTTCLVLTLADPARRNMHLVCGRGVLGKPRGRLYEIAAEANIKENELRLGGPPVDNVAIDEEGSITLVRLISYSAVLGIVLTLLCFRSISASIIVLFVGGISALMSLAIVWWTGSTLDAILMAMPSMIYVLGLSGAAHLMNYYHDAVETHGHVGAPERAVQQGWRPALLCQATTALGLLTLVASELVPIRKFGLFSALAIMVMFAVLLTYLPAALQIWPQTRRRRATSQASSRFHDLLANFWQRVGGWIIEHHFAVATGCTIIIAVSACGMAYMRTSVNMLKMFHRDAKLIKDYTWLEKNIGQLVPMEVVLRIPKADQCPSNGELSKLQEELENPDITRERKAFVERKLHEAQFQLSFLERMELAARVQESLEEEFGSDNRQIVGRALSAATFVRPLPKAGGGTSVRLTRTSMSGRLEAHKEDFCHSDYLRIKPDDQTELWRISLRVNGTTGVDYGAFVSDLKQTVEPLIAAEHERQEILRRLDLYQEESGNIGKPLAGARVLLVGVPAAVANRQTNSAGPSASSPRPVTASGGLQASDQKRIFSRWLADSLMAARLRVDLLSAETKELPADYAKKLETYDCVVILDQVPGLEWADIRSSARLTIDARKHVARKDNDQTAWQRDRGRIAAVYTGVVPIVYKAQRLLLNSLIQSTFWSILTITPLLMWIARSAAAGAVAMLPNVLPIFMVFGGMGWLGLDVDVGAMMTASIALGVAVDDTIHYLNWFREELDRVGDRKQAILAAYKHCATPTVQAALISGLGLSIFAMSTFTPTRQFGLLMLVILWLGAVAELIYFPALLAGPLGSVFQPRGGKQKPNVQTRTVTRPALPQLQVVRHDEPADEAANPPHHDRSPVAPTASKLNRLRHLVDDSAQGRE